MHHDCLRLLKEKGLVFDSEIHTYGSGSVAIDFEIQQLDLDFPHSKPSVWCRLKFAAPDNPVQEPKFCYINTKGPVRESTYYLMMKVFDLVPFICFNVYGNKDPRNGWGPPRKNWGPVERRYKRWQSKRVIPAWGIQQGADESRERDKAKAVRDKNELAEFKAVLITKTLKSLGLNHNDKSGVLERLTTQLGKKLSYREIDALSKQIKHSEAMKSRREQQ
jgi:hypothetical protein